MTMDLEHYRQRLLALERELLARIEREVQTAREAIDDQRSAGDQSIVDEAREGSFALADSDSALLKEVRAALQRMEDGTFGSCAVDGEPIEEKRLEAVPWARYCSKHQEQFEQANTLRTPTL